MSLNHKEHIDLKIWKKKYLSWELIFLCNVHIFALTSLKCNKRNQKQFVNLA